jgi:hypothetical protein
MGTPGVATGFTGMFGCVGLQPNEQFSCDVDDIVDEGRPNETDSAVIECSTALAWPCWYVTPDPTCAPGVAMVIVRTTPALDGTVTNVGCSEI